MTTLVPSHAEPAGHAAHAVRLESEPPDVNEPSGQAEQPSASFSLYALSAPHTVQFSAPAPEKVPARHGTQDEAPAPAYKPAAHATMTLEPSHDEPAGHDSQLVRVRLSPPEVNIPDEQTLQLLAPALL